MAFTMPTMATASMISNLKGLTSQTTTPKLMQSILVTMSRIRATAATILNLKEQITVPMAMAVLTLAIPSTLMMVRTVLSLLDKLVSFTRVI